MKILIVFLVLGIIIGVCSTMIYIGFSNGQVLGGQWIRNSTGDWVCVNIQGMKYERALEICKHEVGHEIFAEECEKNMTKCLEVMG